MKMVTKRITESIREHILMGSPLVDAEDRVAVAAPEAVLVVVVAPEAVALAVVAPEVVVPEAPVDQTEFAELHE